MKPGLKHRKIPEQKIKSKEVHEAHRPSALNSGVDHFEQEANVNADAYAKGKLSHAAHATPLSGFPNPGPRGLPQDFISRLANKQERGLPLPTAWRQDMESAFRTNLSDVRIHSDERAAELNRLIHAKAFTWKENIYLGQNLPEQSSISFRQLLVHELTHTIQQKDSESGAVQRAIELRPPGKGEASAFDRVQELIDRLNSLSTAIQYELQASDLTYTIVDEDALTGFDKQMRAFIDREDMIPMRLVRGMNAVVGDSFWLGYVDMDDLLASDDLGFQSMLLHFIAERFDVYRYADRIGTEGMLPIDLTTRRFRPFFNHAHEAGHQAQVEHLRDVFNDPDIEFNYDEAKPWGDLHMVFKSKPGKYRIFLIIRRAVKTATNAVPAVTRAIVKVRMEDGTWPDVAEFIEKRKAVVQPKLINGGPDDANERAADKAAEAVLAGEKVNTNGTTGSWVKQPIETSVVFDQRLDEQQQFGDQLPTDLRESMESAFGADFSNVRIHTDEKAGYLNQMINAKAFTVGEHLYFRSGMYQPQQAEGKRLLAHELFHAVDQRGGAKVVQRKIYQADAPEEDEEFHPLKTNATSTTGMLSDVLDYLKANFPNHKLKSIILATQFDLRVYDITGNKLLQKYAGRPDEPMVPDGLWSIPAGKGAYGVLGARNGKLDFSKVSLDVKSFSKEMQETLKKKGKSIGLGAYYQMADDELVKQNFVPAIMVSTKIAATGEGTDDSTPEGWAVDKVKNAQDLVGKPKEGKKDEGLFNAGQQAQKTPDKLVVWKRPSDGKQFVNVHVIDKIVDNNGQVKTETKSVAVEVKPTDSPGQLKVKIEQVTEEIRRKLQEQAVKDEEKTITGAGIPYNESTFLGGDKSGGGLKPTKEAYRADVSGPETMVKDGTGNYKMALHFEDVSGILLNQVLEAYGGAEYTWQIIDITELCQKVIDKKLAQVTQDLEDLKAQKQITKKDPIAEEDQIDAMAKVDKVGEHETVSKFDQIARDAKRRYNNQKEDLANTVGDMSAPLESQDGSVEKALRTEVVGAFNLSTAPLSAIFSAGGWLVSAIASVFDMSDEVEKEIPFPNREGYYMVRCVAQPRPKGSGEHYSLRMPSVAFRIVTIKEIKERAKEELKNQVADQQADLVSIALAYQNNTEESKKPELRQALEIKVSELAATDPGYLDEQIKDFTKLKLKEGMGDDEKKRIDTIIEVLGQGKKPDAGYLSVLFDKQIAAKERQIEDLKKNGTPYKVRKAESELDDLKKRQYTAAAREAEMLAAGNPIVRPNAAFVNEEDGKTVPLLIEIAETNHSYTHGYTLTLSDVGSVSGDSYDAVGKTREQALANLFKEYANHFPYGRGYLQVRMPEGNPYGKYTETPRCSPHDTAQASEKLDQLLQVLAIIGMFIPGVGEVAMVAGAAYAAARIMYRINNHTFNWDAAAVMDVLSIIGAVATGVSKIAGAKLVTAQKLFAIVPESEEYEAWVMRLSRFVKVADFVAEGVNDLSYMIGSMETVSNYLEIQRDELMGGLSKSEARKKKIELAKSAMMDQIMQHGPQVVGHFFPNGAKVGGEKQVSPEPTIEPPPPTGTIEPGHKATGTVEPRHEITPPVEPKKPVEEKQSGTTDMPKTQVGEPTPRVAGERAAEPTTVGEMLGEAPGLHGVKDVPLRRGEGLTGDETRVRFEDGKVIIELGPKANSDNVRQHLDTIRMMQRYEGALGYVRRLLSKVGQLIGLGPAFGTRGFEVKAELEKLGKIKAELEEIKSNLEKQMADSNGAKDINAIEAQFSDLLHKISAIEDQARVHEKDMDSTEAGKGYIAMADTGKAMPTKGVVLDAAQKRTLGREKSKLKKQYDDAVKKGTGLAEKIEKLEKLDKQRAASVGDIEKLREIKKDIKNLLGKDFPYEKASDLAETLETLKLMKGSNDQLIGEIDSRLKAIDVQMNPETFRAPFECFSGDTVVQTTSGPKRIDEINIGEIVYTFNEAERTIVENLVTETHSNLTRHFYHVNVKGELIKSTGGHPFYDADNEGWLPLKNFNKGMRFLTLSVEAWPVDEIRFEIYDTARTYNLSIEHNHNYFVGPGILVHNTKPTITTEGAIDTGLGGDQIVYRGTNPGYPKEVYIGRTDRGEGTRQPEHRRTAKYFLELYRQLEGLIKSEGIDPSPAKKKVYDAINNLLKRTEKPFTKDTFAELTAEKHFFEFMSKVELTPIVIGMKTEEQAKFVEQKNMEIEREQLGNTLVNRREETSSSTDELNKTVKAQLKGTSYCP